MRNTEYSINDWALRVLAIENARGIFKTSDEALCKTYETLTDEQKIAFILADGMPSSLQGPQMRTDSDPETGKLPVLR